MMNSCGSSFLHVLWHLSSLSLLSLFFCSMLHARYRWLIPSRISSYIYWQIFLHCFETVSANTIQVPMCLIANLHVKITKNKGCVRPGVPGFKVGLLNGSQWRSIYQRRSWTQPHKSPSTHLYMFYGIQPLSLKHSLYFCHSMLHAQWLIIPEYPSVFILFLRACSHSQINVELRGAHSILLALST